MEIYLHLVPNTPLDFLYRQFFPDGFPGLALPNGLPDFYKRSCGTVFWKLDLERMTQLQRAALRDWYHYAVKVQRVDYNLSAPGIHSDWSDLIPYRDLLPETGLQSAFTSYMTVEPPNLAIAYCESAPGLARYCVPDEYWQNLVTRLVHLSTGRLLQEQERQLQERRFQTLPSQSPQSASLPGPTEPGYDFSAPGYW